MIRIALALLLLRLAHWLVPVDHPARGSLPDVANRIEAAARDRAARLVK